MKTEFYEIKLSVLSLGIRVCRVFVLASWQVSFLKEMIRQIIAEKDPASPADVRLSASINLKNTIKGYWRKGGISNAEKKLLRNQLLCHIREEDDKIAQKLASGISKIARVDYPRDWPELFSELANQLKEADILISHRTFGVLSRIIRKLSRDSEAVERNFAEISSHFFDCCWVQWRHDMKSLLQNFSSDQCFSMNTSVKQEVLRLTCERWFFCTNIVLQLSLSKSEDNTVKGQPIKDMCSEFKNAVILFRPYYSKFHEAFFQKKIHEAHPKLVFIQRACVRLVELLVHMQNMHPYPFSDRTVLKPILEFCLDEIMDLKPSGTPPFEQFLIKCMVMVKSVLECIGGKRRLICAGVSGRGHNAMILKQNISKVVSLVLPSGRAKHLCRILIKRYFPLTEKDLEEWSQNAEKFYYEQNNLWWMEKLRPCAEALYIVLFDHYRKVLGPFVHSILLKAMNDGPTKEKDTLSDKFFREAAYTAVAHVRYELSGILSFSDWFRRVLLTELYDDHPYMHIIHWKVAFILQNWVVEIKGDMKKTVFDAVIRLLKYGDLAVRLAACQSLTVLVERIDFQEEGFTDVLSSCLDECFKLLKVFGDIRSKAHVLNLFISIIEYMGEKIIPFANEVMNFFQEVWVETTDGSVLWRRVHGELCDFISEIGTQSPVCYIILQPMLKMCLHVNNPDALDLLMDEMLLLESAISNAQLMVPQLLELFPYLLAVMEKSFDNFQTKVDDNFDLFKVAMKIFEGYIILGEREVLSKHASVFAQLLGIIETLVQEFPEDVPPLIRNILQKLIVIFLSGGDDCVPSEASVKAIVGAILARLFVKNTSYFVDLTSEQSFYVALRQVGVSVKQNIILHITDLWIDEIANMTAAQREISALALSIVLTSPEPFVLDKLGQILSVCKSVLLGGCEDVNGDDSSKDASSLSSPDTVRADEFRRKKIKYSDPVLQFSLRKSLKSNLETCRARHGNSSFNAAISKMHPTAFEQLQQALELAPESDLSPAVSTNLFS